MAAATYWNLPKSSFENVHQKFHQKVHQKVHQSIIWVIKQRFNENVGSGSRGRAGGRRRSRPSPCGRSWSTRGSSSSPRAPGWPRRRTWASKKSSGLVTAGPVWQAFDGSFSAVPKLMFAINFEYSFCCMLSRSTRVAHFCTAPTPKSDKNCRSDVAQNLPHVLKYCQSQTLAKCQPSFG